MLKFFTGILLCLWIPAFAETRTTLTEAQITEVLETINEGEISSAQMALDKSENAEVKDFAKTMIDEHKKSKKDTVKIAQKNKLNGTPSDLSKSLQTDAEKTNKEISARKRADFDRAYIDGQIKTHESVLNAINEQLIPSAKSTELVDHLEKTRITVAKHLEHAKELKSKLQ